MKRRIILFLILFVSFVYSASSLKTFEVDETEKLSLGLKTDDPDDDNLVYTFTEPLDDNGEWQTTYGDAGEYTVTITVSDGENQVSEEILIIVHKKEAEPSIDSFAPKDDFIAIDEGGSVKFEIAASDLNDEELTYKWLLDGGAVSDNKEFLFETDYEDNGEYTVKFTVSDGTFNVSKEWDVNVNDVALDNILEQIEAISVLEGETASLKLPNFKKYGLSHSISEPLGNKNKWKTGFDDAGNYTVKIAAEGKGFKGDKDVKVIVRNNDRAPQLVELNNMWAKEGEQLSVELNAVDPDDDEIILSAQDIPETAKLDGNIFTWTPGYDFVQKNGVFDYVLDKFRLLGRNINVIFIARSGGLSDKKTVKIVVKDVNQPFVLEGLEDIEVDEGEEIVIEPKYNDPDNDLVSFSYSGFMDRNKKKTGYDDAGEYIVKVVARDGFHREIRFIDITVNDVNRKPAFDMTDASEVAEGNELRIVLSAADSDNDAVSFSARNMPKGAKLKDNLFVWKPEFDVVTGTEKEFSVDFIASDGVDEVTQKVKITVLNVNQAPEIISSSDNLIALKNEPMLFEVNVADVDGDELTYSWSFGFFDKYEDGAQHQRIFSTAGSKKVEVIVNDGVDSVSKVWNVVVV